MNHLRNGLLIIYVEKYVFFINKSNYQYFEWPFILKCLVTDYNLLKQPVYGYNENPFAHFKLFEMADCNKGIIYFLIMWMTKNFLNNVVLRMVDETYVHGAMTEKRQA